MSDIPAPPAVQPVTTAPKHEHIGMFDWLRTIAILAVLVLHTAALEWYSTPVDSIDWQLLNLFDSAVRFCVPIFFMVSGALFLDPARRITIRSILTRSLPRILVPFAVWSLFYAILTTYGPGGDHSLSNLAVRFVLGHYHLWFLIALAGLYLATPILRRLVEQRALLWYFVVLAGVFATIVPLAEKLPVAGSVLAGFFATMQFQIVLGYSVYFVLGYLIFTASITRRVLTTLIILGAASFVVTVVGTSLLSLRAGGPDGLLYGYSTPNVVMMAVAVFALVKRATHGDEPAPAPRWVALIATCSFGIYLVHPFFQELLQAAGVTTAIATPALTVPVLALAIGLPSLAVAFLLRRIPRIGRWIS